jgi:hypothetical protein
VEVTVESDDLMGDEDQIERFMSRVTRRTLRSIYSLNHFGVELGSTNHWISCIVCAASSAR